MGLFSSSAVGVVSVDTTSIPSDFGAFLSWWKQLTFPKERQDSRLVNFVKVIENPVATMISGSSVLAYRQNKKPFGNDIDIFIDCSVNDSKSVIDNFMAYLGSSNVQRDYTSVSSEDYPFEKSDCLLETRKYKLVEPNLILNFIFLNEVENKSVQSTQNQKLCSNLGNLNYEFFLGKLLDRNLDDEDDPFINLLGGTFLVGQFIRNSFDFEELKYSWNFKEEETQTVFKQSSVVLLLLKEKLDSIERHSISGVNKTELKKLIREFDTAIEKNDAEEEKFISSFNNTKFLTLSSNITYELGIKCSVSNDPSVFADLDSMPVGNISASSRLITLTRRLEKYSGYGYQVKDPSGVTVSLMFAISATTASLFDNKVLGATMRSSILGQRYPNILKQYKFISGMRSLVTSFWKSVTNVDTPKENIQAFDFNL